VSTLTPRTRTLLLGAAVLLLAAGLVTTGWLLPNRPPTGQASASRQAEVAAKGRVVMPFDLDRTTHVFEELADGGRQTVTADDPTDHQQVRLIQAHLRDEQAAFARGDFADPAAIHGQAMAGLAELTAGVGRVRVRYRALGDGAELRYRTSDPVLVAALHAWFTAQTSDHGRHADQH
jgi:hypothetical protein